MSNDRDRFLVIEYQFLNPKSAFRWEGIWWYKSSWNSRSVGINADIQLNFDENCLVACSDSNVKNDYKNWAVDSYLTKYSQNQFQFQFDIPNEK